MDNKQKIKDYFTQFPQLTVGKWENLYLHEVLWINVKGRSTRLKIILSGELISINFLDNNKSVHEISLFVKNISDIKKTIDIKLEELKKTKNILEIVSNCLM